MYFYRHFNYGTSNTTMKMDFSTIFGNQHSGLMIRLVSHCRSFDATNTSEVDSSVYSRKSTPTLTIAMGCFRKFKTHCQNKNTFIYWTNKYRSMRTCVKNSFSVGCCALLIMSSSIIVISGLFSFLFLSSRRSRHVVRCCVVICQP